MRHREPKLTVMASIAAVGLALVVTTASPSAVCAQQVVFDWGGDTTSDSGKQSVRFNGPGKPGDIIVSFGDRRLYFITGPGIADSYPIAIPREQSRWEGVTSVTMKRENPSWTPTPTMLAENPRLPRWVPGGHPMNPLGNRALYLGSSAYRIHGTDAPWTIGTAASKGCVRLFNKDVADLYPRVKMGARVTVTWQTFSGRATPIAGGTTPAAVVSPVASGPRSTAGSDEPTAETVAATSSDVDAASFFFGGPSVDAPAEPRSAKRNRQGGDTAAATAASDKPKAKRAEQRRKPTNDDDEAAAEAAAAATASSDADDSSEPLTAAERKAKRDAAKAAARSERPKTTKPRKSDRPVETGSVDTDRARAAPADADVSTTDATKSTVAAPAVEDAASVAARAEAAAKRAAEAAEKAAAAAARAAAATQKTTSVE